MKTFTNLVMGRESVIPAVIFGFPKCRFAQKKVPIHSCIYMDSQEIFIFRPHSLLALSPLGYNMTDTPYFLPPVPSFPYVMDKKRY